MSGGFDERRRSFEEKWAHDEELQFRVHARGAKLTGLWAAGEMGLSPADAEDYAGRCVAADVSEAGDEDLFRKLRADFDAKAIARSDHLLRTKIAESMEIAKQQIMTEG